MLYHFYRAPSDTVLCESITVLQFTDSLKILKFELHLNGPTLDSSIMKSSLKAGEGGLEMMMLL